MTCPWTAQALSDAAKDSGEFFRFCAGVAHEFIEQRNITSGLHLKITKMDLPLRKGVSSSAAVCVLIAKAFSTVYQLGLSHRELMEIAYRGERLTGSPCGRMDQACVYGQTPVLLTFDSTDKIQISQIFPKQNLYMFFVDLGGRKDTEQILKDLRLAYLINSQLQQALGSDNKKIIDQAHKLLESGNIEGLGYLMTKAQNLFDSAVAPNSPDQLDSPLLHCLLAFDKIQPYIWGGKGVGSQGDGTAQFVARSKEACELAMATINQSFPMMRCFPLTIDCTNKKELE